jgi:hypothetical protein
MDYQSKLGACGSCDLFSEQFGLQLSQYVMAKIAILTADLWNLITSGKAGYIPFLGDIDLLFKIERFIAYAFIEQQQEHYCNFPCVTENLGLGVYAYYATYHVYSIAELFVVLSIQKGALCP